MSKKISKMNSDYMDMEIIDTPPTEYVEENVYIDENFIKNKDLIRIDLNIIQFPIFSKNTKRKVNQVVKYYFNQNKDTYITVSPSAGDYIPGETEEKIFIALMQIMKEKGMPKKFIVTVAELKERLKMNTGRYLSIIRNSLSRLATSNYSFKNTLYSSESKGVLSEEIKTTIFTMRTITLSLKENTYYRDAINDKRVKEIYEINISEHFYQNIIQKGYLVYNGNTLLEIESSTARTIYMLVEKLRFDNLYLKLDTIFLIKRIPLKQSKKNIDKNIKTLEKAFEELVEKNLILSFNFIKESTWEKSEIEIKFPENAVIEKQNRFYDDRNDLRKILTSQPEVSDMMNSMLAEVHDIETIDNIGSATITREMIDEIIGLLPSKAKALKTMPRTIKESIDLYGYDKVKKSAIYTKKQKPEKVRAYFLKALESDWAVDDEIISPQSKIETPVEEAANSLPAYNESLYNKFEELSEDIQAGIEGYAYRIYVEQCGMDTKIQKLAFRASRKKYICEFLEKYPETLKDEKKNEEVEVIEPVKVTEVTQDNAIMEDIQVVKKSISDAVEIAELINMYTEDEKVSLKTKIIAEIYPIYKKKMLTTELLDKILTEHTGM